MAKTTWRRDTDGDEPPFDTSENECALCVRNDVTKTREGAMRRLEHYVQIAADYGTDALKTHLETYVRQWYPHDGERAREVIHGHMGWVWDQVNAYGGLVDQQTGETLSWYTGRQQATAAMHVFYVRGAAKSAQEHKPQQATPRVVKDGHMPTTPAPVSYMGIAGQVLYEFDDADMEWMNQDIEEAE